MDHSELGENFGKFRFKFIEPEEYDSVLKILEDYLYISMEPTGYKPEYADDMNDFFRGMISGGHNLSYMAVDSETGEIAAVRVVDLVPRGRKVEVPTFRHKANTDAFKCCNEICKDIKYCEQFDIPEYPEMFGLCTVDKYRQQGLATQMYSRGLKFLKKRGYKIVRVGFVSPYTRRAGYKQGYIESARCKFLDMRNEDGEVLNPNADPEEFICFGYFDLRD